jgi:lipoyl(octanoyl) transferase
MNHRPNKTTYCQDLGLIDYQEAWDLQVSLFEAIVATKIANRPLEAEDQQITSNHLLMCEHPHVYTLGKSGKRDHLLIDEAQLPDYQATYYVTSRGGDITYHGPGQLICYPIIDLENFFTDIHQYMRLLEEAVILTLLDYGIVAGRIPGLTGVWLDHEAQVKPRKICAMGVKTSRWVAMHGLALNVNTDLAYFNHIVPCGIVDKAVTSMHQELGKNLNMPEVSLTLRNHIMTLFEMTIGN